MHNANGDSNGGASHHRNHDSGTYVEKKERAHVRGVENWVKNVAKQKISVSMQNWMESLNGTPIPDGHGHGPIPLAIRGHALDLVDEHICALPATGSHYFHADDAATSH